MDDEFEAAWKKRPWETKSRTDKDRAWFWWQTSRAAPAQGEPVALIVERTIREYCRKSPGFPNLSISGMAMDIAEAVAALPSSPAPVSASPHEGMVQQTSPDHGGAGEAISPADLAEVLENVKAAIEKIKQTKILSGGPGYIDAGYVPLELHKACQALTHMTKGRGHE